MRAHTQDFKDQIKKMGREIDSRITYNNKVLTSEELYSVYPSVNGSLLKSAMKELQFESSVQVPNNTIIKYEFGLKVDSEYEYLDYGNYIVYSSEINEDTKIYKHTCYDCMLFSMKDYEKLPVVYPATIREYITAICNYLGIIFANKNDTFVNYDKIIPSELYLDSNDNSLGYTFRDVLDELAQVTASTICINENDELEVRYITDTNDMIDAEYFKNVNVKFGEKYGPINSIVLSRSAESDNVYLRDEDSVITNGLCELKIIDNQIMNFNNRDEFLPEILGKLNGLEYHLNDFSSTGICYYDLCDRYSVKIDDNIYSCVMFNDEILVTQGLEENIYTEMPEETQTDYTKADKTDRKINQTYLIVDKQNQMIESVVSQTNEQNEKIAKVTQTVEELNSKISDIADITISAEDNDAQVEFEGINQSEPIRIVIRPILENISYLYPSSGLYPSDTLYPKVRTVRFTNIKTEEVFDYELPADLLYYDSENYDEFILDYDGQSCVINKRVGYNSDGTTHVLESEKTLEFEYPRINLTDGDYKVSVLGYDTAYLFVRLMAQNIYTTQFATRAEVNSEISQTANKISSEIEQKFSNYSTTTEVNNKIVQEITDSENKINLEVSKKVNDKDYTKANIIAKINDNTSEALINADVINLSANDILNLLAGNTINLTSKNIVISSNNFNVDANGNLSIASARSAPTISIEGKGFTGENNVMKLMSDGLNIYNLSGQELLITRNSRRYINGQYHDSFNLEVKCTNGSSSLLSGGDVMVQNSNGYTKAGMYGESGIVECVNLYQSSQAEQKKNFEKLENALEIIDKVDIYKYHFKEQKDNEKKHIGFVIGDKYKYSDEITSINDNGVDIYSMVSVCFKAIQEQQLIIEKLKKEINVLKGE